MVVVLPATLPPPLLCRRIVPAAASLCKEAIQICLGEYQDIDSFLAVLELRRRKERARPRAPVWARVAKRKNQCSRRQNGGLSSTRKTRNIKKTSQLLPSPQAQEEARRRAAAFRARVLRHCRRRCSVEARRRFLGRRRRRRRRRPCRGGGHGRALRRDGLPRRPG